MDLTLVKKYLRARVAMRYAISTLHFVTFYHVLKKNCSRTSIITNKASQRGVFFAPVGRRYVIKE
jgi:hypothetical protein